MPNTTPAPSEVPSGDDDNDEENIGTPIRPSAKALGKRRLMNVEDPYLGAFDPDDISSQRTDGCDKRNPAPDDSERSDSDSNSVHRGWPQQPGHYAYDAVTERTQR
ncbi:hypothetical protein BJV78DRAFT_1176234 [Lactifluus subvellereus]|nr:hypothetical protein BJV78DRAFT_1176234 [Lactifluus subvellereus]